MKQWIVTEGAQGEWILALVDRDGRSLREHPIPFHTQRDADRAAARLNTHYENPPHAHLDEH